jgi:methionyl-tRNA formyltransferase
MRIIFFGTPEFAIPILEKLHKKHEVLLVVTQPDKKVGRRQVITAPIVKKRAQELMIKVFQPLNIKEEYQKIIKLQPDLIVTAAYGQILPKELLNQVKALNVHGSLLPKYRGGAPIQKAIINGDSHTGITIMEMAYKMDSGDILKQAPIEIKNDDTTTTLTERLSHLGADLLIETLDQLNEIKPIKQAEEMVTYAYNITYEDQIINWNQDSKLVIKHINAMQNEPGAITYLNKVLFKVSRAKESDIIYREPPGTVVILDKELIVATKTYGIKILEIQQAGKKNMNIKDFLNGQSIIKIKDIFERN